MFTFDLKSGYHHVEVVEAHRKYLGFDGKYFQFSVLPFGLLSSSYMYVFFKLMQPLVKLW